MRLPLVLVLLGALGACTVDLVEPSDRACDDTHPCQSGQWCRVDECTSLSPDQWGDGGTLPGDGGSDGGLPSDAGVTVNVVPSTWAMNLGAQKQFAVEVAGTSDTEVTWSYSPQTADASISPEGVFTAPSAPGTFQVKATSNADTTRSGTATVTVYEGPPTAGLIAHYAADQLLGAGVPLPPAGPITEWKDLSGNGHHLTKPTNVSAPTLKLNDHKGLPIVVFNGIDQALASTAFPQSDPQANTVVLVFRAVAGEVTFVDSPDTANRHRLKMGTLLNNNWSLQMNAGAFARTANKNLFTSTTIGEVGPIVRSVNFFDGESSRQRFDGMEPTLQPDHYKNLGTGGLSGIQMGLKQDLKPEASNQAPAHIAEVLYYDHALTDSELALVESYLAKRYAP